MANNIFKGVIYSLIPSRRTGFIAPIWAKTNEDNIFFHFSELKDHCLVPALQNEEARTTIITKSGMKVVKPVEPQVVYFEIKLDDRLDKPTFKAVNVRDTAHVSDEDAEAASQNTTKPHVKDLMEPTIEINVAVTPETIHATPDVTPEKCEAAGVEENVEPVKVTTTMEQLEAQLASDTKTAPSYNYEEEDDEEEEDDNDYNDYDEYYDYYDRKSKRAKKFKDNKQK